jgi:hypothetical protein
MVVLVSNFRATLDASRFLLLKNKSIRSVATQGEQIENNTVSSIFVSSVSSEERSLKKEDIIIGN